MIVSIKCSHAHMSCTCNHAMHIFHDAHMQCAHTICSSPQSIILYYSLHSLRSIHSMANHRFISLMVAMVVIDPHPLISPYTPHTPHSILHSLRIKCITRMHSPFSVLFCCPYPVSMYYNVIISILPIHNIIKCQSLCFHNQH